MRHVVVAHQQRKGPTVDLSQECRMRTQCLQFRPEQEALAAAAIIQRLDSQPVAGQVKFAVFPIP
jgi:hypothetical protein